MRHRRLWVMAAFCMASYCGPASATVISDTIMLRSTGDLIELCTVVPSDPMGTAALDFCHSYEQGNSVGREFTGH